MNPLKTTAIAFSTYSVIPMPRFDWQEQDMRYALCAFPLVGAVLGVLYYGWAAFSKGLSLSPALFASVSLLLPILITGGIHLDGFCDVSDALASHQSRERKLEILKDSRIGAFAAIKCTAFLLLQFGLFCQLGTDSAALIALSFIFSRALSALLSFCLPKARRNGMLYTYTGSANSRPGIGFTLALVLLCGAAMIFVSPLKGSIACTLSVLWCLIYKRQTARHFGGVTGDTAGWFLQICEILILSSAVLGGLTERFIL